MTNELTEAESSVITSKRPSLGTEALRGCSSSGDFLGSCGAHEVAAWPKHPTWLTFSSWICHPLVGQGFACTSSHFKVCRSKDIKTKRFLVLNIPPSCPHGSACVADHACVSQISLVLHDFWLSRSAAV